MRASLRLQHLLADVLDESRLLSELPPGVDRCGERGEFHTFCFAGPMFASEIAVEVGETVSRDGFSFTDLVPVRAGEAPEA